MRVAFISQPLDYVAPPVQGGSISIWTDRVMHAFHDYPCEFLVYAAKFPNQSSTESYQGIQYKRVLATPDEKAAKPFKTVERALDFPRPKRPYFASTLNYLGYILQIARDLRKQRCDIVHVHNFSQFVPVIRAYNPEAKIVLHMQCEWLSQLDRAMIEKRIRAADLVITCSEYVTNLVRQRFPQYAGRCHTVYNGVDIEHFASNRSWNGKSGQRLLFVGRVSPEKGTHDLLSAFQTVAQRFPTGHLDIVGPVGSAPYEYMVLVSDDPRVNALAIYYPGRFRRSSYEFRLKNSLPPSISSRINFTGSVSHSSVIDYYRQADILINPSLTEAFGNSLIEAMASSVPVIATRVGGMVEIVKEGETGLLTEPANPSALAEAIVTMLSDDELRRCMGEAGYQRVVELFSWDKIASSLWRQYTALVT